jgi:toxin secretion/phage lysis holin
LGPESATTMKEEMDEMIKAHLKLWAHLSDVKLWLWTVVMTTGLAWVEQYVYRDWEFLKFLMVLMVIDLFTGVISAMKNKVAVTSLGLRRSVIKLIQYGVFLIVMHILSSFTINGEVQSVYHWVTQGGYIFLIGVEAKSILENIAKLDDRFDIGSFIERIKEVFTKKKD